MRRVTISAACFFWLAALCGSLVSPAFGQEKFFEGKPIRIIVGFSAAGRFDAHSRATSRHMSKHIPGSPSIQVENIAGAGSMIAANYVYNQAKPDAITIGNWIGGLILQQALDAKGIAFDAAKFEWVGAPVRIKKIFAFLRKSGITSLENWNKSKPLVKNSSDAAGSAQTN